MTTTLQDAPPRFTVFKAADHGWVLRDAEHGRDYPFHSRDAAIIGAQKRRLHDWFIGADTRASVYGEPLESVERFS